MPAPLRFDAPAGQRSRQAGPRQARLLMAREQQAGRVRGLRGKAKAARDERRFDLDLRERCDERPALQPLFKRPGGILCRPRLDDEKERGVEAEPRKSGPVRSPPLMRRIFGEAPQDEAPALGLRGSFGDCGKGEGKRGRAIAIGGGLDLVEPALLELMERKFSLRPERGFRHTRT
jgi:hypothetical protein